MDVWLQDVLRDLCTWLSGVLNTTPPSQNPAQRQIGCAQTPKHPAFPATPTYQKQPVSTPHPLQFHCKHSGKFCHRILLLAPAGWLAKDRSNQT